MRMLLVRVEWAGMVVSTFESYGAGELALRCGRDGCLRLLEFEICWTLVGFVE